jgi:hypothetical protein
VSRNEPRKIEQADAVRDFVEKVEAAVHTRA